MLDDAIDQTPNINFENNMVRNKSFYKSLFFSRNHILYKKAIDERDISIVCLETSW